MCLSNRRGGGGGSGFQLAGVACRVSGGDRIYVGHLFHRSISGHRYLFVVLFLGLNGKGANNMNLLMPRRLLILTLITGAITLCGPAAKAEFYDGITYGGKVSETGKGFGNAGHNLLVLQGKNSNKNHSYSEWGSVEWNADNGADAIVNSHNVVTSGANSTATISFGELRDLGYNSSNLALHFDLNQSSNAATITVNNFELLFFRPDSSEAQFRIGHVGSLILGEETGGGSGNWDHYFAVDLGQYAEDFDAAGDDWRVGMRISEAQALGTSEAGADVFGFSAVPEPSSIALWSLLGGIGLFMGWRQRRQHTD